MVKSCSAYNCVARSTNNLISFHRFPTEPKLRALWTRATRRENFVPTNSSVLCSKHFQDTDYLRLTPKKVLKNDAVPSVFDFPKHLQAKLGKTRRILKRHPLPDSGNRKDEQPSTSSPCVQSNLQSESVCLRERKRKYFGDFTEKDLECPKKAKLMWMIGKKLINAKNKQLKILRSKNKRLQERVVTLQNLVEHLKKSHRISDDCEFFLNESLTGTQKQLLLRQMKSTAAKKFPPELRSFALTLHFYSSSAYHYVRKTFNKCLPHPSTLRKWISSVDGSPGFTNEALKVITAKAEELKKNNRVLVCSLIMDEMSIRKYVEWTGKRYVGYVDFGSGITDSDALPEAKEALVFLLVAMNARWKTGFKGVIISILSVQNMFEDLVKTNIMDYILTFKVSQDHIEMFFAAIRSRGARQFEGAYKRLLLQTEIKTSASANCVQVDNTSILTISSSCRKSHVDDLLVSMHEEQNSTHSEEIPDYGNWSPYLIDVNDYVSGFVARRIAKSIKCAICADALFVSESRSCLLNRKNRGGLLKASSDVIKICQVAENVFRLFTTSTTTPDINKMILHGLRKITHGYNLFASLTSHILNQDAIHNHVLQLITLILRVYFPVRIHHMNKNVNEVNVRIRQVYNKLILFKNQ